MLYIWYQVSQAKVGPDGRVRQAGVTIIETRLTRLSYAPEIAQAMLRQQQATQQVVNTGSLYQ